MKKADIITGLISYVEKEIIPKMSDDKAFQIILSVLVNTLRTNKTLTDKVFENDIFRTITKQDGDSYDLNPLFDILTDSVSKYGYFPVTIPAIPFVSPTEKELKFDAEDIKTLKGYMK